MKLGLIAPYFLPFQSAGTERAKSYAQVISGDNELYIYAPLYKNDSSPFTTHFTDKNNIHINYIKTPFLRKFWAPFETYPRNI